MQGNLTSQLTIFLGMTLVSSSIMISIINPELKLRQARDTAHALNIRALKKAADAYAVSYPLPNCSKFKQACPSEFFPITGTDPFSAPLLAKDYLGVLPNPPTTTSKDCYYAAQLFPAEAKKYRLRWCYESWTQADVNTATNQGYNCQWQTSSQVAICYTDTEFDIPAP